MADTQTQEPSMEEILASIRRIISEDGATVEPTKPDEDVVSPVDESVVFDLVEEVKDDGSVNNIMEDFAPVVQPESAPVVEMEDTPPPEPVPVAAAPTATLSFDNDRLISDTAAQASASALSGLTRMMNTGVNITSMPIGEGHKTLESMVLEMLRPILKDWLDRNLPVMVERIVQKEIQKITRDLG